MFVREEESERDMASTTIRALLALGILVGVLTLAACGSPADAPAAPDTAQQPAPTATSAPAQQPKDASMSQATPAAQPADGSAGPGFRMQTHEGRTFKQYSSPPAMMIDPSARYTATITTNKGAIVIDLMAASAPKTVNSFVFLAEDGFYDGLIFHRVIENFMIQGGDPTGLGVAGPGYRFEDEIDPSAQFDRPGLLAMANSGPNTNGSQFFITTVPTPHLNGGHTIFGTVTQGQDVAVAISKVEKGPGDRPLEPVVIQSVKIEKSG